jgi:glycosyltransferase involved in cell wall biosynthesis
MDGTLNRAEFDRPLRLAIFSDSAPPIINGVSVSIQALTDGLRARGHEVHLFATGYPNRNESVEFEHRFFGVMTPASKDYPLAIPPFIKCRAEFDKINFDLVHTHTPFTVGYMGKRWAKSAGVPVVSTYHTHYDEYAHYAPLLPEDQVRKWIRAHTERYYEDVDHIITPSDASLRWLRSHNVHQDASVIPTGVPVPTPLDRAESRTKLGLKMDSEIIVTVGRLSHEKSVDRTIRAFAFVAEARPHAELVIVGDGPAREELEELSHNLGISPKVHFIGAVHPSEVAPYYAAADVFAFSSTTETQGLVIIEAMSHGLPALIARGGGAQHAVDDGDSGLILDASEHVLADALIHVLEDPDLRERLSKGARVTADEYSIDRMIDRILYVYIQVLRSKLHEPVSAV